MLKAAVEDLKKNRGFRESLTFIGREEDISLLRRSGSLSKQLACLYPTAEIMV